MLKLVIDANVVKGYFLETVTSTSHALTASPMMIFESLDRELTVVLDQGGQIASEWQSVVDREWFNAWYPGLLASGQAETIPVQSEGQLRKALRNLGFPDHSRDIWYIRAAKAIRRKPENVSLIAEDIDFFDPTKKSLHGEPRERVLKSKRSPIAAYLREKEGISVFCAYTYLFGFDSEPRDSRFQDTQQ